MNGNDIIKIVNILIENNIIIYVIDG
jgi:hypothetical protein